MKTFLILPLCAVSLLLLPMAGAQTPGIQAEQTVASPQVAQNCTFIYRTDKKLDSMSVAGNFNNWNKSANPMAVDTDGLTWRGTLPLKPGKYLYKFVLNGDVWVSDPATQSETDADGNTNSVLTLTAAGNTSAVSTQTAPGNADKVVILTPDKVREASATPHTFIYRADKKLDSVAMAGEFNGWNKEANPLKVDADGLTWRTTLKAPDGYQYKFVLNGATWVVDPQNPNRFTEASGNVNSLIVPADYQKEAAPDDGQTATSALSHKPKLPYLNYDRGQLRFLLRARPDDVSRVWLQIGARRVPMTQVRSTGIYAWYGTTIAWDRKSNLSYSFGLWDGDSVRGFGTDGLKSSPRPFQLKAKTFQPFTVPDWVEKTVFYQIFPDRFENGDKTNDPTGVVSWNSAPTGNSRFGGDIAGVKQHLNYLSDLGISGVYFNPVFKSPSPHRYDAQDYRQIDPQFGTNAQFAALTKELQRKGIRTVMDFVFNHTATSFAPFADVRKNGPTSTYKDWYLIKSFPVRVQEPPNYIGWNGYSSMPKLNLMNPATGDYMLGLVNYWKKQIPLAGLRLDVADEVDIRFWRQLRARVKGLDPQMWIVGERWSDASPWLEGDQWDAAMNYPFLWANSDFFADDKISASQFTGRLIELYNSYPPQVSRNMLNMLSSHDRPRFLTVAHNAARLQQLAATVQFTWVGAPSVYYGEELGMEGGPDPDNRRGMEWQKATPANPMLRFYKRLIAIRKGSRALQSGTPAILTTNDSAKALAYSRTLGNDTAIVALNRSDKEQTLKIRLPQNAKTVRFIEAWSNQPFTGKQGNLSVKLAPFSSAILLRPQN